jgi:hypothetical protein
MGALVTPEVNQSETVEQIVLGPLRTPSEQLIAVRGLVQRVDYDGAKQTVAIRFDPAGLRKVAGVERSPPEVLDS